MTLHLSLVVHSLNLLFKHLSSSKIYINIILHKINAYNFLKEVLQGKCQKSNWKLSNEFKTIEQTDLLLEQNQETQPELNCRHAQAIHQIQYISYAPTKRLNH